MTTSNDHRPSSAPRPSGEHWYEMTATLSRDSTEEFGHWLSDELELLERQFQHFSTPNSRSNSVRR